MKKTLLNRSRIAAIFAAATLVGCGGSASDSATVTDITTVNPIQPVTDWQLVWADEFDGSAIDAEKWTHEVNCDGGGNQELQCYTDSAENSFVSDGTLKIVAKLNDGAAGDSDDDYTSARLNTQYKGDFKYGRIEMRAKLPKGQGTWPAFWMMPTDSVYGGWPKSGEVDIVEAVNLGADRADGSAESNIYGTIHYGAGPSSDFSGAAHTPASNPADSFNRYAIEWQEGEIRWYFNDVLYATQRQSELQTNSSGEVTGLRHRGWYAELYDIATGQLETDYSSAPFDQDFFLILNLAVGGSWPSSVNEGGVDPTMFTGAGQTYEIDYVRVYQCAADPQTGRGCETTAPGYNVPVEDGGKLVSGKAPSPTLSAGEPDPITIFDDETNLSWVAWDCCGGTTPALVADDAARGNVYEFTVSESGGANGTVFGFITRSLFLPQDPSLGISAAPHNALAMAESGYVTFDVKVMSQPTDADARWMFKIEADEGNAGAWEQPLSNFGPAPSVGQWTTYQIPLADIQAAGVDLTSLDVIMVFPEWMRGAGAVFRMDNVAILDGAATGGTPDVVYEPAAFTEAFGNASVTDNTFIFPTGAEAWAGFANKNEAIYPMEFPNGGSISFTAFVPEGSPDVDVRFVFEFNPYPDVNPTFGSDVVTVSGSEARTYTIELPAQDAENTYSSFLLYLNTQDAPVNITNVVVTQKGISAGTPDVDYDPAAFTEAFGNASITDGNTYLFPTGAEAWAGFANKNEAIYPMEFPNGGKITFRAAIPEGGVAVDVRYVFEFNPYPDVNPTFGTDVVTVNTTELTTYTVEFPAQDAGNTYSSFLMYLNTQDAPVIITDVVVTQKGQAGAVAADVVTDPAAFTEAFGNATATDGTFVFPTGAEDWAGFANKNEVMYPLQFPNGGKITFTGSAPEGSPGANVRFVFEFNPYPDVNPTFGVGPVFVSGAEATYTIEIPAQDAENTYSSFLMYLNDRDAPVNVSNVVVTQYQIGDLEAPAGGNTGGDTSGEASTGVQMTGVFGGATIANGVYTFPTGAEDYAGFANDNTDEYPYSFPYGGTVTFIASVAEGVADTNLRFRFERRPYPNADPAFDLELVTISGSTPTEYTVAIPAQDDEATFESFLMYIVERDQGVTVTDIVVTANSSLADMSGVFGNFVKDGDTYTFPGSAEAWAGTANLNTALYPMDLSRGGFITFTAALAADEVDTGVYFRFENLPNPDNSVAFNTETVTVSGTDEVVYRAEIPAQAGDTTYSSFLMYLVERDSTVTVKDIKVTAFTDEAIMSVFGGSTRTGATYEWPTGAEGYAGFANDNTSLYPLSFPNGGTVTFDAALPAGGSDTNVSFRFERLAYPDVDPAFSTNAVTVTGEVMTTYTVTFDAQDAANTYSSFLMYLGEQDQPVIIKNIKVTATE